MREARTCFFTRRLACHGFCLFFWPTNFRSRRSASGLHWPRCLVAAALLAAVAGCGFVANVRPAPVFPATGKIVFDGQPLTGRSLWCCIQKDRLGRQAGLRPHAQAAADGSFTLTSYESNDGALAGDYHAHRRVPRAGEPRRRRDGWPERSAAQVDGRAETSRRSRCKLPPVEISSAGDPNHEVSRRLTLESRL